MPQEKTVKKVVVRGETVKRVCLVCKKSFTEYASRLRAEPFRAKCCSRKCKGILSRNKITKKCAVCGSLFTTHPSNEKQAIRMTCSWSCRNEWFSGERSHLWVCGSRAPYPPTFNNTIKRRVRSIDNYKCAICGVHEDVIGYKLHVHHIDCNKSNLNISNLVSFCRSCHRREHNYLLMEKT